MTNNLEYVGYRNPPKATQFKKGQSGNPNGRPKVSKNESPLLRELSSIVSLVEDGKRKKLSKIQIASKALVNKAMRGDLGALKLLLPYMLLEEKSEEDVWAGMFDKNGEPMTKEKAIDEIMLALTGEVPPKDKN